ncbi:hypothetical protein PT974_11974 [Cladobotryum mycophilum]|uniref:Protein kinase domain-containing protein n=1 Tax=Cladobotryum mycophilum TaxID=491253 RepID=A0ABR0S7T3_9HYPO
MDDIYESKGIRIESISSDEADGTALTFRYNGRHINVSLFKSAVSQDQEQGSNSRQETPLEDRLLRLLDRAVTADRPEDYKELTHEALDAMLDIGKGLFCQVVPPASLHNLDLHSLLYPEALDFCLETVDGRATISQIDPEEAVWVPEDEPDPGMITDFQADIRIPQYSSRDIQVQDVFHTRESSVSRVRVGGRDMLCKAVSIGLGDSNLERELVKLQNIWTACLDTGRTFRVPKIQAYVKHAESEAIIGFLSEWIPSSGVHGRTLSETDVFAVPAELRRKWADQIRETVNELHEIGVVWGDGKAANVIIDVNDDAWLIDFAGQWTRGWVDTRELVGTKEGDYQAVENIVGFLDLK